MGPGRRRAVAVPVVIAALVAAGAVALTRSDTPSEPAVPRADTAGPVPATASAVVDDIPSPGRPALVGVAVANVWNEPGLARPVDDPSLADPVDIRRWISAMSHEDKLWLVDRLVTQALYGERVIVREIRGTWARVVVTGQPSSLDPAGYPGWVPAVQLRARDAPATPSSAVVTRPAAALRDASDPARPPLELSYNTRLPVLGVAADEVAVALPTGGRGLLAAADVEVSGIGPHAAGWAGLVRSAQLFSGLPYLWAGRRPPASTARVSPLPSTAFTAWCSPATRTTRPASAPRWTGRASSPATCSSSLPTASSAPSPTSRCTSGTA